MLYPLCIFVLTIALQTQSKIVDKRISWDKRKFHSTVIDGLINSTVPKMKDPDLATLFQNCLPNPLDTTVNYTQNGYGPGVPDTFVITGDITAMWLRDTLFQLWPYLKYASQDPKLQNMLKGVIHRMAHSILIDSYANAFNYKEADSPWQKDHRYPTMNKKLWEGKYELDTLASVLRFSNGYFSSTNDLTAFNSEWILAIATILQTVKTEQQGTEEQQYPFYYFQRKTYEPTDSREHGIGSPGVRCGMAKSAFRPSDDSTTYPFLVPSNLMMSHELSQVSGILGKLGRHTFAQAALNLSAEISAGVQQWGTVQHPKFGKIYAYETDGTASWNFMDDGNCPSLLGLPYLGVVSNTDPIYVNTRKFLLSTNMPYYFKGTAGEGIGSPHTGINFIWPMSVIMQAYTSNDDTEILRCLDIIKRSADPTSWMHESFNRDNTSDYTRSWFAWANSFYGDLILHLIKTKPHLILK